MACEQFQDQDFADLVVIEHFPSSLPKSDCNANELNQPIKSLATSPKVSLESSKSYCESRHARFQMSKRFQVQGRCGVRPISQNGEQTNTKPMRQSRKNCSTWTVFKDVLLLVAANTPWPQESATIGVEKTPPVPATPFKTRPPSAPLFLHACGCRYRENAKVSYCRD